MSLNIIADYHTHTNLAKGISFITAVLGTHAKGSIQDNANIARKRALQEIAITDHGYKQVLFGVKAGYYREARKIIDDLNQYYSNNHNKFKLLLGVECNIVSSRGDIDIDESILKYLDIICAGYHRGAIQERSTKLNYTDAVINAINKYDIAILNHPFEYVSPDIIEIGKIAVKRNTAIELNRNHKNMSIDQVRQLKALGVKFSLGSDSHKADDIGCFGVAYSIAVQAGLTNDDIVNADGAAHKSLKLLARK